MKSCWEFRKHAQIGESATKKDSCGQFEFLRLSCLGHLFGWGLFIQIPSPDFLLAFVWVGVGYGVHFKNWIQYPSFIHIDALFRLFSMNMTYIHVPNITCRFTTPHSGGPSICQLSSPASAELEQALVLPIDHVSNFEWPGPEVAHQLSWSHGVSTSINHGTGLSQPGPNHTGLVIPTTMAWYNNIPSYSALWLG